MEHISIPPWSTPRIIIIGLKLSVQLAPQKLYITHQTETVFWGSMRGCSASLAFCHDLGNHRLGEQTLLGENWKEGVSGVKKAAGILTIP